MTRDHTHPESHAREPVPRGRRVGASVLLGLGGLVATPALVYATALLLHGSRASWSEGQGEGFVAFLTAVYAMPAGAGYWAIAGAAMTGATSSARRRRITTAALVVFVAAVVAMTVLVMRGAA